MTYLIKTTLFFFMTVLFAQGAVNSVLTDPAFPYRIICGTGWAQEVKNDTVLRLKSTAPEKKTRFQLQKYIIDTSCYDSLTLANKGWSRLRYAVNYELATKVGQVIWVDSSDDKKLGKYRAFELCAYFSEKSETGTLWWAEYSRWTDHNGFGYLASIIGDTSDMKNRENFASYKALMDSISLSQLNTIIADSKFMITTIKRFDNMPHYWYNALGRNLPGHAHNPAMILMKKNTKQCSIR